MEAGFVHLFRFPLSARTAYSKQFKIQASLQIKRCWKDWILLGWPSIVHFFPAQVGEYHPLSYIPVWYNEEYIYLGFFVLFCGVLGGQGLLFSCFVCFLLLVIETTYNDENSARRLLLIYFTLLGEHTVSQEEVPSFLSARSHLCSRLSLLRSFV